MTHEDVLRLDAAYAMGALDADETARVDAHLATCPPCRDAVAEARATLTLLALVPAGAEPDEAPPDTVLPGLLHRAARERTRRRGLLAATAVAVAACLAGVIVGLWPASTAPSDHVPAARQFVATVATPVRAYGSLVSTTWGTQIDVHCSYAVGVDRPYTYRMRVVPRRGGSVEVGNWQVPPRGDVSYVSGTSLRVSQIKLVQILRPDGTPVLQLTN